MSASVPAKHLQSGLPWMLWPVRLLSLGALAISGYLFWASAGGGPIAGCDPASGFDCSAALSSRWAQWFGIPVLWIGAACYAVMFVASWGLARRSGGLRAASWRLFTTAALVAAGAGFWFLGLQLVGQSSLCLYCIGIHACGLLIATMVGVYLLAARITQPRQPAAASIIGLRSALGPRTNISAAAGSVSPPPLFASYAGALVALMALVGGQLFFVPPRYQVTAGNLDRAIDLDASAESPPESLPGKEKASSDAERHAVMKIDAEADSPSDITPKAVNDSPPTGGPATVAELTSKRKKGGSRNVSFLNGKLTLDLYEHPVLGSPEAEHVVVEFFDYTCPHCRKLHQLINEALPRYGDQLAIVMLPVPIDIRCNKHVPRQLENHQGACKIANLAVAMNSIDPVAFVKLHDWLMEHEDSPTYPQSISHAMKLGGESRVLAELSQSDVPERVERYIETFAALGRLGKTTLPLMIVGDEVVTGEYASAEELGAVWEEQLGITATK